MPTHAQSTTVKWFWSGMQGAPGSPTLKAMFEACLINGFNQLTCDSLVISGGVATVTRASGHGYTLDSIINISGVTSPAGINGDHRVLSVTTTTFTFDADSFSDETATGTIVTKTAPVGGWTIPFSSGNDFVLRSGDPASPRGYYRFAGSTSDAYGRQGTAYEIMSDLNTGQNQWGGTDQYFQDTWPTWMLWADKRNVYWSVAYSHSGYSEQGFYGLGDFISFLQGDTHNEFLHLARDGSTGTNPMQTPSNMLDNRLAGYSGSYPNSGRLRRHSVGTIGGCGFYPLQQGINTQSGYNGITFPSPVNNAIVLADVLWRERGSGDALRGRARGIFWVFNNQPLNDQWPPQTVEGVAGLDGRKLHIATFTSGDNTAIQRGRVAIDITGPWEV